MWIQVWFLYGACRILMPWNLKATDTVLPIPKSDENILSSIHWDSGKCQHHSRPVYHGHLHGPPAVQTEFMLLWVRSGVYSPTSKEIAAFFTKPAILIHHGQNFPWYKAEKFLYDLWQKEASCTIIKANHSKYPTTHAHSKLSTKLSHPSWP